MFPDVMMFHEKSVLHNFYTRLIQHLKKTDAHSISDMLK